MLSPFSRNLKSDRFQTLRNKSQQHATTCNKSVQKQVTCIQTMLGVLDQQCFVRLLGALVYLSSLKEFKNLFGLKKWFLRLLMRLGPLKLPPESTLSPVQTDTHFWPTTPAVRLHTLLHIIRGLLFGVVEFRKV